MTSSEFETKIWDITFPCIVKEIKKGAKTVKELKERCGASKSTVYRIIKALEKAGLVEWKKGEYVKWKSEIQAFESKENYEIALNHSKRILIDALGRKNKEIEIEDCEKLLYNEQFIQHLKTGYPSIYNLYEKFKELEEIIKTEQEIFKKIIRDELRKYNFEIVEDFNKAVDRRIYSSIYEMIYNYYDYLLDLGYFINISIENSGIVVDKTSGYSLSKDPDIVKEIENIIYELLRSENLKKTCDRIKKIKNKRDRTFSDLLKAIKWLIKKINHGEPLKGYCDLCPMVIVKEVNEE